jgi:subtilisin family serine protease
MRSAWLVLIVALIVSVATASGGAKAQFSFGGFGPRGGFGYSAGPRPFAPQQRGQSVTRPGRYPAMRETYDRRPGWSRRPTRTSDFARGDGRRYERRPPRHVVIVPVRPRLPVVVIPSSPIVRGEPVRQQVFAPSGGPPPPPPAAQAPSAGFTLPGVGERRYIPNEILIETVGRTSPTRLRQLERRLGLTLLASAHIDLLDADLLRYRLGDTGSVRDAIRALSGSAEVATAQPNFVFEVQDDAKSGRETALASEGSVQRSESANNRAPGPSRSLQYAIDAMKLDGAHRMATGADVLIAVIDTGLDETHPEIAGRVADRFDAVGGAFRPQAHGTAMAGVIVAHQSLVGVAPGARLLAIRAFDNMSTGSGQGTSYDIIRGLDFAAVRHAQIVNMSFAGPHDGLLAAALAKARDGGMIEIAAAGNAGPGAEPLFPGAEPGVIAVTATDTHNKLFDMANRGDYVAVAAPGVDILAPSTGAAMQLTSGTSVAAAEASGVVALILEGHPATGGEVVRKVLGETAVPIVGQTGEKTELIDAQAALTTMSR